MAIQAEDQNGGHDGKNELNGQNGQNGLNGHDQQGLLIEIPVGQLPTKRVRRNVLVKRHMAHLAAKADEADEARPVKQVIIEQAYPASIMSIRDLELMPLSQLRIETHHRGQGIVVQAVTPVYRGVGAVSVVVDAQGNADKMTIYNHSDTSILAHLPPGCVVAVKEPYYKFNGPNDCMICVDHPSDVILLRLDDPLVPAELRTADAALAVQKTAAEWAKAGDSAFVQQDYPTAAFCYTEAIEAASDDTTRAGIYIKRGGTNLLLGRFDAAKDDGLAVQARRPGADEWRGFLTAARAMYGLCRYGESKALYEQALEQTGKGPGQSAAAGVRREYERCLARLAEEEQGEAAYDFRAMYGQLSAQTVHLDRGSFLRRTRVGRSALHGNGMFAAEAIAAGEVVFIEKAAFMPNQYEPTRASAALYATMVRQMYDNPSLAGAVMQLYAGDLPRSGREADIVDGVPVVDVFLAENIRLKNCFSAPLATFDDTKPDRGAAAGRAVSSASASASGAGSTPGAPGLAKGVWRHASYLNHSCVPNTMRSFLGDIFISRAVRDIAAGDEIFQQYVPVRSDPEARQRELRTGWGFDCACPLCAGERLAAPDGQARRRALLSAVEKLANKHPPHRFPPDAAVRSVERLLRQIDALYDQEPAAIYGPGRPRLGLVYPAMWLLRAHRCRRHHAKVVRYVVKTLACFGFSCPPAPHDARGPAAMYACSAAANALHTIHVVSALRIGARAHRELGNAADADAFEDAARFGYRIITGFEDDLEAIDEDNIA